MTGTYPNVVENSGNGLNRRDDELFPDMLIRK